MITLQEKQAYASKLLTANQAAKLMEPAFYDWVIPPTGAEIRVGYGRITPYDLRPTLFFYILESRTNIVAQMRERTEAPELLVAVAPEHPENGAFIIDPAKWGRWELMAESLRDIWPYRSIGKQPYLQSMLSFCRRRHEVNLANDITLVYVKTETDYHFVLRESFEER